MSTNEVDHKPEIDSCLEQGDLSSYRDLSLDASKTQDQAEPRASFALSGSDVMGLGFKRKILGVATGAILAVGAVVPASAQKNSQYDRDKYVAHSEKYLKKNCPVVIGWGSEINKKKDSKAGIRGWLDYKKITFTRPDGFEDSSFATQFKWQIDPKKLTFCGLVGYRYERTSDEKVKGKYVPLSPTRLTPSRGEYTTTIQNRSNEVVYTRVYAKKKR